MIRTENREPASLRVVVTVSFSVVRLLLIDRCLVEGIKQSRLLSRPRRTAKNEPLQQVDAWEVGVLIKVSLINV